jgi:hypothetical protein
MAGPSWEDIDGVYVKYMSDLQGFYKSDRTRPYHVRRAVFALTG